VKILNKEMNYRKLMIKEAIEIENIRMISIEKMVGKLVMRGNQ